VYLSKAPTVIFPFIMRSFLLSLLAALLCLASTDAQLLFNRDMSLKKKNCIPQNGRGCDKDKDCCEGTVCGTIFEKSPRICTPCGRIGEFCCVDHHHKLKCDKGLKCDSRGALCERK